MKKEKGATPRRDITRRRHRSRFGLAAFAVASAVAVAALASGEPVRVVPVAAGSTVEVDSDARAGHAAPTYSRSSYVWPFATGPFYGAPPIPRGDSADVPVLRTVVGDFDLTAGTLGIPDALATTNQLDRLGRQYFVVQADPTAIPHDALGEIDTAIEAHGGSVVHHLPEAARIARLTPEALEALAGLSATSSSPAPRAPT